MCPLFFDFPKDEAVRDIGDQYMFGDALMVAPVLKDGAQLTIEG